MLPDLQTDFRVGVAELGLRYVLGVRPGTSVWAPGTEPLPPLPWSGHGRRPTRLRRDAEHQPVTLKALALSLPAHTWREGTQGKLSSRFAAVRVRPAHRDTQRSEPWPEEWLLIDPRRTSFRVMQEFTAVELDVMRNM